MAPLLAATLALGLASLPGAAQAAPPDAPEVYSDSETVAMDSPTVLTLYAYSESAVTFAVTQPNIGTLGAPGAATCDEGGCRASVTYTPPKQGFGNAGFTFTASNASGASDPTPFDLYFNARPVAAADSVSVAPGTTTGLNVLANDTDADGDYLEITAGTPATRGAVFCNATSCTYTSPSGYSGPDAFTYTVNDGRPGGTATGTVRINVVGAVTRPGTPSIGSASAGKRRGPKTAVVRWGAPASTGGAAITAYVVKAYKYKGRKLLRTKSATVAANRRSYDMRLGAGKWRFRVAAVNGVGSGAFSGLSNLAKAK